MTLTEDPLQSLNESADYWRYDIGVNVIPADTVNKKPLVAWSEYQNKPIPEELHNRWKAEGAFSKGIAIIPGKVCHRQDKKDLYFIFIDADSKKAITELLTRNEITSSLQEAAKKWLVEQHEDNKEKAHIYFYSPIPFPQKSADSELGLEVKGLGEHGIAFCFPSIHRDGKPYEIIGTNQPEILTDLQAQELIQHIDQICWKYGILYLEKNSRMSNDLKNIVKNLVIDHSVKIQQGQRHITLISLADSLLFRHLGKNSEEELRKFLDQINYQLCEPEPLPESEIDNIWNSAIDFVSQNKEEHNGIRNKPDQLTSFTKLLSEEGEDDGDDEESDSSSSKSTSEVLLELASKNIKLLFKDQYGVAHALVQIADHQEIIRVESSKFKRFLARLFYEDNENKVINAESITNAIQVLHAKAEYEGQTIPLYLRVAWHSDDIYYDLTDEKWQYIKISKEGWQLMSNIPVPMFIRHNQTAQVAPDRNYELDIFDRFLQLTNIKEEKDRILLKVYIVSLIIPDIPHVILILHGRQGSAKSTLQTMIKLLVDPAKPKLLTVYNDVKELIQQLAHNHIAYYDNLKKAPGWLSDESCKAVTGVGSTKRKLYSDDDDIVYEYRRCLGFSGINAALTEPDALDRSMMIELKRIDPKYRKDEKIVIAEFLELRPKLLGYIFDILVKALQIKPTLKLNDLPRMADFALWGEAIARAMGYKDLEFIHAYYDNIGKQNIEALENHPLGQAIARFILEKQDVLEGSPMEILEQLEIFAEDNKIKTDHTLWPKAANSLTRRLNQISSNLLEGLGIDVQITRVTDMKGKFNTSFIRIRKVSKIPPEPPEPPETQNHEGNKAKNTGGILSTGDIIPPVGEIPLVKNTENYAQKSDTGDTGDTGGIFSIEGGRVVNNENDKDNGKEKTNILPITCVEEFFNNNTNEEWQPYLPGHGLEQSPCYPIIDQRLYHNEYASNEWYYCKIHPEVESIYLDVIEHHCKFKEPERHKAEIIKHISKS